MHMVARAHLGRQGVERGSVGQGIRERRKQVDRMLLGLLLGLLLLLQLVLHPALSVRPSIRPLVGRSVTLSSKTRKINISEQIVDRDSILGSLDAS